VVRRDTILEIQGSITAVNIYIYIYICKLNERRQLPLSMATQVTDRSLCYLTSSSHCTRCAASNNRITVNDVMERRQKESDQSYLKHFLCSAVGLTNVMEELGQNTKFLHNFLTVPVPSTKWYWRRMYVRRHNKMHRKSEHTECTECGFKTPLYVTLSFEIRLFTGIM